MNAADIRLAAQETPAAPVRRAHADCDDPDALNKIQRDLGPGPFALVVLFVTPSVDFADTVHHASEAFADTTVLACSTAGEISDKGYTEDEIVAVALSAEYFQTNTLLIERLSEIDQQTLIDKTIRARSALSRRTPNWTHEFAFLLIDGLSLKEDELAFALATGMGPVPLFGGSAGDGTRFEETFVALDGQIYQNAAIATFVRSVCRVQVFSVNHLTPTDRRMVVTDADPRRRIVRRINTEPAAREYARVLGKDPEQLTPFTFAAHPVVVTIGGTHHVRAIQQVTEEGELVFFSAIDEGLVLTLAEPEDIVAHTKDALADLSASEQPTAILACDCILRRLEAGQKQRTTELSRTLADHNVVGFSTYGEQLNAMHVNHTMTGVAIYPPEPGVATGDSDEELAGGPQ